MADSISFPLSKYHLAQLAQIKTRSERAQIEFNAAQDALNQVITAVIGATHDPVQFQDGWTVEQKDEAIVCTPKELAKQQLLQDIGPDGVSEAAATS